MTVSATFECEPTPTPVRNDFFFSSLSDVARTTTGNLLLSHLQSLYLAGRETGKPHKVPLSFRDFKQIMSNVYTAVSTASDTGMTELRGTPARVLFVSSFSG